MRREHASHGGLSRKLPGGERVDAGDISPVGSGKQLRDGASRDRTGDLLLAKQALSQLSYGPREARF